MPAIKRNKTTTTTTAAGLRETSQALSSSSEEEKHDFGYFPLTQTRFPVGTPILSKRSKKFYSDFADDREFLLHLREIWVKKLESLKEDHKLLQKMKEIKKEELHNIDPLFAPDATSIVSEAQAQPAAEVSKTATDQASSSSEATKDSETLPFQFVDDQIVIQEPKMLSTLEQLENMCRSMDSDEENANDEDEDQARHALHLMLKEFGESL
ncbi:uncharacterized protein B0P05DRAFT_332962 [Gilbertella persicaria]|uniref:uncharacterized protein n=1 Tax=Gilbertella persicaria TaxID=101096 RepID=UPI00221E757B|nr:uncharacterized protein B0P05DRAFT_332962 [Gilbertella persicaria]KAI8049436.1 hypothetical protein B0P05DRAFT_332962 [Gilbertella persicaria]